MLVMEGANIHIYLSIHNGKANIKFFFLGANLQHAHMEHELIPLPPYVPRI